MRNYQQLDVWKKAHTLTLDIYRLTANFPTQERYGLTSQLQRGSASIGANIAEGCGRQTGPDFNRFIQMATGSAFEVEYHLLLAHDLKLIKTDDYQPLNARINEVKRMLHGLARYLEPEPKPRLQPK